VYFALKCEYSPPKAMGRPRRRQSARSPQGSSSAPGTVPVSPDYMDAGSFPGIIDQFMDDFNAPLPPMSMEYAPAQRGQRALPSLSMNGVGSRSGGERGMREPQTHGNPHVSHRTSTGNGEPASRRTNALGAGTPATSSKRCYCVEMVNQHFSMIEDSLETFQALRVLKQSMESAKKVLECRVCFESVSSPRTSRNVLLLGSLLSSIGSSYGDFFYHQKRRAAESSISGEPIDLVVGQPPEERSTVELAVDGETYVAFLKASLKLELDRLFGLRDGFAERQRQLHTEGHEFCQTGTSCSNIASRLADKHPGEVCPKEVDMTQACACFRTVDQVRAVIEEAQKIIMA
jgi:hypothetical protein